MIRQRLYVIGGRERIGFSGLGHDVLNVKLGRFGCAKCYQTFKGQLKPILRRLHSGNCTHNGKIPKRVGGKIHLRKNIEGLKLQLKELISEEEFEKAAEIRDEIRSLEKRLEHGLEGGG